MTEKTCVGCKHHKVVHTVANNQYHDRCLRLATDLWGVACDLETMHNGPANAPWCGPDRKFHEARTT